MIGHASLYGIAFTCNCVFVAGTLLSPLIKIDSESAFNPYKSGDPSGPNEYDYAIVKRGSQDTQETPDSKERRSQMGSSFIRFGRSHFEQGNLPNVLDYSSMPGDAVGNEFVETMPGTSSGSSTRTARGRSDVIIRFGRSELKNLRGMSAVGRQLGRSDLVKLLEYGNKRRTKLFTGLPLDEASRSHDRSNDLDRRVAIVCSNIIANTASFAINGNNLAVDPGLRVFGKLFRLCDSLGAEIEENDENNRRIRSKIIEIIEDDASQAESIKRE